MGAAKVGVVDGNAKGSEVVGKIDGDKVGSAVVRGGRRGSGTSPCQVGTGTYDAMDVGINVNECVTPGSFSGEFLPYAACVSVVAYTVLL